MKKRRIIYILIGCLFAVSVLFNAYYLISSITGNSVSDTVTMFSGAQSEDSDFNYEISTDSSTTEMLIVNASITIKAEDNAAVDSAVRTRVKAVDGKVTSSYDYLIDEVNKTYTLQVRIPASGYDDFIAFLKGQGDTDSFYESSYDVYDQYQDNELRITMYQNKLDRLYELMDQASDMSDLLTIEDSISDTIYQIESLEQSQQQMEYDTQYATVSITIEPIVTEAVESSGLNNIFQNAFTGSVNAFLVFIEWFIKILFFILPYALLIAVGYFGYRRIRKH